MSVEAISAVLHNSKAKGTHKLVLIGIANHEGDGGAWPTLETLGKYAACSRSTVKAAIRWLEKNGEIEVRQNAGGNANTRPDRRPNLYKVLVPAYEGRKTAPRTDNGGQKTDSRGSEIAFTGGDLPTPNRPIEPSLLEPSINTSFDAFWKTYPRHSAKPKAREAFEKQILKGVSADAIIEGAARFARDPNRVDQFTPHPATWLNQGRWEDEPLPERGDKQTRRMRTLEELTKNYLGEWTQNELSRN